ncbi:Protein of uncharacterised function (DUF2778) [Burkholderia pseudomallei]|uniref:DUF2778 domain-containing protein n=1 Tax=pseudomallei group TaxID=111527 RepID=UPI00016AABDD|nr:MULTISPECIES: tlde1 domain-containing protein [pseudomallei group]APY94891.1 hypothetical protein BGI50_17930 [Burkholderia pseudomallei]KGU58488.1 hypothetical protein Y037_5178 [Burkholderia pseudomallei MSHR983]KGW61406.1 hypothetical protein Y039_5441 [Burkholderia pseudomallei MSHR1029]KNA30910.1 hypothetical protein ADU20_28090 [Burkholderia pseudomallei]MBM5645558.1 DUF2778 domain-containing protein [Burkholderia pseudomallei]
MPVECTFSLSGQRASILRCAGFGSVAAFSGNGRYVNDPKSTAVPNDGPLPTGVYYIVDRQSGGRMGWLNDFRADLLAGTHRADWFALYRNDGVIDDWTSINGIRRGHFRLHPVGYWGISEGCITLPQKSQFEALRKFLKSQPTGVVPGTSMKYYGRVTVQ